MFEIGEKEKTQLNKVSVEEEIVRLQNEKDSMNNKIAIQLNELQLVRNFMQTKESSIKSDEKRNKIKGDFLKNMMGQGGGFNGQNVLHDNVPQEQEAQGLPMIERLNQ